MSESNTPEHQDAPERSNTVAWWVVIVIAVILLAAVGWWWLSGDQKSSSSEAFTPTPEPVESATTAEPEPVEPEPVEPEPKVEPQPEPVEASQPEPQPEPEPAPELPELGKSTPTVLQTLDSSGVAIQPLKSSQLVRDAVVIIDNLRNGTLVRERTVVQRPDGRFQVIEIDDQLYIDEQSYQRYDAMVDWFISLDAQALADNYLLFKPLIQEAFGEIGYPDSDFNQALFEAIDVLLGTPVPETLVAVEDDEVMYTYANPAYEALPPAQKQLLRMGPDNIERVKQKLREIRQVLKANL